VHKALAFRRQHEDKIQIDQAPCLYQCIEKRGRTSKKGPPWNIEIEENQRFVPQYRRCCGLPSGRRATVVCGTPCAVRTSNNCTSPVHLWTGDSLLVPEREERKFPITQQKMT
jgi:hypothetical protein